MENGLIKTYYAVLLAALLGLPVLTYGQNGSKSFDLEVNVGYNNVQDFTMNYNASVSHWLRPNRFALITGLGFSHTYHDLNYTAKIGGKTYSIDNNNTFQINGIIGAELLQPISRIGGLILNVSFLFNPLPVSKTSFDVWGSGGKTGHKNKWVFNQFNPGCMLKAGYYFDTKIFNSPVRVSLGAGASWQDGLKGYRLVNLENTRFGNQIPKNKVSYGGFIKVIHFF